MSDWFYLWSDYTDTANVLNGRKFGKISFKILKISSVIQKKLKTGIFSLFIGMGVRLF